VIRGGSSAVAPFVATLRRRRHLTNARHSKFAEGLRAAALVPGRIALCQPGAAGRTRAFVERATAGP
jgi:hypothetical protein